MRIAITNDDGIRAEGLKVLMDWACQKGEVVVFAPKEEQSAKSHGIEIHKPFEVKRVQMDHGIIGYSVDSTPADCVRYAILGRHEKFDLIISGVNRGLNIGQDIIYSATVGAAFEAAALGVKALAISTDPASFASAASHLDAVYDYIANNDLLAKNDLYNINIPLNVTGGIRITHQGGPYYSDDFLPLENDLFRPMGKCVYRDRGDLDLDTDAVMNGCISITPLTIDRTHIGVYESLKGLNAQG